MCQKYLAEFDGCVVQLTAVNEKLERRIELNSRYKDAVSTDDCVETRNIC
jgi:hypothetical protein